MIPATPGNLLAKSAKRAQMGGKRDSDQTGCRSPIRPLPFRFAPPTLFQGSGARPGTRLVSWRMTCRGLEAEEFALAGERSSERGGFWAICY